MLVAGASAGTLLEWACHVRLGWPESVVALAVCACLFVMFERVGRYFAPVGAVALIPMIVPPQDLFRLPVQIPAGRLSSSLWHCCCSSAVMHGTGGNSSIVSCLRRCGAIFPGRTGACRNDRRAGNGVSVSVGT